VLLYELLTGTTPFDRERLRTAGYDEIRRIIREEEPPRPSTRISTLGQAASTVSANRNSDAKRLSHLFRGELDWIVMKALEKDRNRRYESASAFAADVQHYLADEPVQACPPSAGYRLRKFVRRNRRALATAAVLGVALLTAVGGVAWAVGWANRDREARQAAVEQEASLAMKEGEHWEEQRKWPEALSAAKRAEGLLAGGGSDDLRNRARELRRDVEMVLRLEDARLQGLDGPKDGWNVVNDARDAAYLKAFRDYGIDLEALPADEAAERIRARSICLELTATLDALLPQAKQGDKLLAIARAADPDELRNRVRETVWEGQRKKAQLAELARSQQVRALPPPTLCALGMALVWAGLTDDAVTLLRDAQQRHPDDFWINFDLAQALTTRRPPLQDQVIRYYSAAVALRPGGAVPICRLGQALWANGQRDEAIACYRKVVELAPNWVWVHHELGEALARADQLDEAIAEYRKAVALEPRMPGFQRDLGKALGRKGQREEALACFQKAVELSANNFDVTTAVGNAVLGNELAQVGRWSDAATRFDRALALDPRDPDPHHWCLAAALHATVGDFQGYRRTCRDMLKRFGDTDEAPTAERIAKACLLLPGALDAADFDRVQKLADRAVAGSEKFRFYPSPVLAKGLTEYRAGRNADAVTWLQRFAPKPDGVHWDATAFAVLAMAHHGLGRAEEAQAALAKAKAILAQKMPDPARGQLFDDGYWPDWVHAQVLCHEAEQLLKKDSGIGNQETEKKP
jgi:tetratricopeptide (TPR) repeat protein